MVSWRARARSPIFVLMRKVSAARHATVHNNQYIQWLVHVYDDFFLLSPEIQTHPQFTVKYSVDFRFSQVQLQVQSIHLSYLWTTCFVNCFHTMWWSSDSWYKRSLCCAVTHWRCKLIIIPDYFRWKFITFATYELFGIQNISCTIGESRRN